MIAVASFLSEKTNVSFDPFGVRSQFDTGAGQATLYSLKKLEEAGLGAISKLPFSIRVLLEAVLRNCDGFTVTEEDVKNLAAWNAEAPAKQEVPFKPYRVVLQDFTGVPAVVDLAAMRSAMERIGGDPEKINPLIPVDLVIDHSVQVDHFGSDQALPQNVEIEFKRNQERYEFLRWGQQAFDNFRVVPPNVGIVHQVNLEYLAKVVAIRETEDGPVALPDTLVGTDSHTTMINGLGVLGWGVGGIEAEANMLGQPLYMLMPEVIGFELTGSLPAGATATDMVLQVVEMLRQEGVVGKFVEFFGPGRSLDSHSRNYVLCPGNAYDRSPCGTGTSAKLACLAADGALAPDQEWIQESVIGSRFIGRYTPGENGQIHPSITGSAYVYGETKLIQNPGDPFKHGIGR